jgi:16S rRNA (cytidine1402-2'-O)-methyltransferase
LRAHYEAAKPRGEITVLIAPPDVKILGAAEIDAMLRDAMRVQSRRDAVQAVADMSGQSRRAIYARALELGEDETRDETQKEEAANATPSQSQADKDA